MLSKVDGVRRVEFVQGQIGAEGGRIDKNLPVLLPSTLLFQPLLADPRWPNFSAFFSYLFERLYYLIYSHDLFFKRKSPQYRNTGKEILKYVFEGEPDCNGSDSHCTQSF